MCRGRLDEAAAVPVTDPRAIEGQERLMRWLYGVADECTREGEFASLTALAAQCLTPKMLRRAHPELRPVLPWTAISDPGPSPICPRCGPTRCGWRLPPNVAQRLSARGYRPERPVLWLNLHQPGPEYPWKRLYWRNQRCTGPPWYSARSITTRAHG